MWLAIDLPSCMAVLPLFHMQVPSEPREKQALLSHSSDTARRPKYGASVSMAAKECCGFTQPAWPANAARTYILECSGILFCVACHLCRCLRFQKVYLGPLPGALPVVGKRALWTLAHPSSLSQGQPINSEGRQSVPICYVWKSSRNILCSRLQMFIPARCICASKVACRGKLLCPTYQLRLSMPSKSPHLYLHRRIQGGKVRFGDPPTRPAQP